jgi:hypothetical protein
MKTLRQLCVVLVLMLALAFSAFAGDIETGKSATPPPQQATSAGQIDIGKAGEIQTPLTVEIALNLLQGVLSLI